MIISIIIQLFALIITWVVSIIPPLPQLDSSITDIGTFLSTFIGGGFGIVRYIYGDPLFGAIIIAVLALIFFNQGYWLVRWILRMMKINI